jgi:hypothetical protein
MVGFRAKTVSNFAKVAKKAADAVFRNLGHAAAFIRTVARRSIRTSPKPGRPGGPPRTRGQRRLRNAILYFLERDVGRATIGPDAQIVGEGVGGALEHGGEFRGEYYPPRPFMGPALEKARPKLPKFWADSIR